MTLKKYHKNDKIIKNDFLKYDKRIKMILKLKNIKNNIKRIE